jgi:choline dehydrogenase-like flavoprotein
MMRNGADIPTCTKLSTQVCIIGSGPAGITLAWELQKAGIKVILLEGSRGWTNVEASWPDKVRLYDGQAVGLFEKNEPEFLILRYKPHQSSANERERIFGGTSTHWGGQVRPQDPIDLAARDGFPGWLMDRTELDPFYDRASKLLMLSGDYFPDAKNFSADYWAGVLQARVPKLDGFDVEMYQIVGPDYKVFSRRKFEGRTIDRTSVDVILNATVLEIENCNGKVKKLHVASMNQDLEPKPATRFTVTADVYVLACGAVANARQLLLAEIKDDHEQVGRYFMCHPLSEGQPISMTHFLGRDEARLMNGETPTGPWTDRNGVGLTGRFIPNEQMTKDEKIGRCWFWYVWGQYYYEPTPNPDSRITLADTEDKVFSQPQVRIDWQLSDDDQHTYERTTSLFRDAVKKNYNGLVRFDSWEDVKSQLIVNGHHIGTTRISEGPETGVVDRNLKVHTVDNLYVAGASVFPSAGISNPTFTIVMFSIRLADELKKRFGAR